MTRSPRTYGGVEGSARIAQRRQMLIDAGLDLLGTTELSVRGVCRVAGVASRYFYESFADRDALMEAVYDSVVEHVVTTALEAVAVAGDDARTRVRAGVAAIARLVHEDPRRGRLLFSATLTNDVLTAKREQSTRMFARLLAAQATEYFGRHADGAADVRLELTTHYAVGGFAQVLTSWLGGGLELDEETLVDYCTDLIVASSPFPTQHLTPTPPPARDGR